MVADELEPGALGVAARAAPGIGGDDRQCATGVCGHRKSGLDQRALYATTSEGRQSSSAAEHGGRTQDHDARRPDGLPVHYGDECGHPGSERIIWFQASTRSRSVSRVYPNPSSRVVDQARAVEASTVWISTVPERAAGAVPVALRGCRVCA